MRLLNAHTLHFESFFSDDQTPSYAILSHTWGDEEVSYQDMMYEDVVENLSPGFGDASLQAAVTVAASIQFSKVGDTPTKQRQGYQKILKTAQIAKEKGYDYFWIDTCCIDKTSSAELQEAINSMWRWYQRSAYCLVYLEDFRPTAITLEQHGYYTCDPRLLWEKLPRTRWITRGWTLQELIAPRHVGFYDADWQYYCTKHELLYYIQDCTKIPVSVLSTGDLSQSSVAQKMSWAAERTTTRIEDIAYSLMGIFGVHMPMLYGEGENAFRRLQEQIINTDSDDSILAWRSEDEPRSSGDAAAIRGALACSPRDFGECYDIMKGETSTASITLEGNHWLRLRGLRVSHFNGAEGDLHIELNARLNTSECSLVLAGLMLPTLASGNEKNKDIQCIRLYAKRISIRKRQEVFGQVRCDVWLPLKPTIPWDFNPTAVHCCHFQRPTNDSSDVQYAISPIYPSEGWLPNERTLQTEALFRADTTYFVVFLLVPYLAPREHVPVCLVIGFDPLIQKFWWSSLRVDPIHQIEWPAPPARHETWERAIMSANLDKHSASPTLLDGGTTCDGLMPCLSMHPFRCQMRPGIWDNKISLIISIEGLVEL